MSKEFEKLQLLLSQKKCEIKVKHHMRDIFGVWLHGVGTTRPAFWNLFGYAGGIYMFLSSWIVWVPISLFLGYKYDWIYLIAFLIPFLVKIILKPVGQGFLLADLKINEELFNALWNRKAIGIVSVKKKESIVHKDGVPEVIVDSDSGLPDYVADWKSRISEMEVLETSMKE